MKKKIAKIIPLVKTEFGKPQIDKTIQKRISDFYLKSLLEIDELLDGKKNEEN